MLPSRSFLAGLLLALPIGFTTGMLLGFLVTPDHITKVRQLVSKRALGHDPQVDFEALQQ